MFLKMSRSRRLVALALQAHHKAESIEKNVPNNFEVDITHRQYFTNESNTSPELFELRPVVGEDTNTRIIVDESLSIETPAMHIIAEVWENCEYVVENELDYFAENLENNNYYSPII